MINLEKKGCCSGVKYQALLLEFLQSYQAEMHQLHLSNHFYGKENIHFHLTRIIVSFNPILYYISKELK